jgi:hypothetical protein
MKRVFVLAVVCVVITVMLGSCQAPKKCPAYSHNAAKTVPVQVS